MELEGKNIASEIKRQVENGFSKKGIIQNLLSMGYSQSDIDKALKDIDIPEPVYNRGSSEENYGGVTTKQMITGAIVAILIIFRIIRIISRI
ncbi:hypothetical protein BWK63_02920 [Flavobacterium covae]|uniref:UBA domain-containing protein n=1 Tax=Flavobacterium covae TaxID=2906076 RepID=A0ABW8PE65_9FLAO|nr:MULTISPECIES: hypothetical protein [Flavobacterium]OWP82062.1 hypothetical protein BWK63_02920 [Flavobacterium covae]POR23604.1 hypothetical protein BWK57_00835 [Flavobacterium columnare]